MDLVFISVYLYWMFNINTGRILYSTALFYIVRAFTQMIVTFSFPEGYYWKDPHFPSIVVPYGRNSDFFFSGHCGFLNLCGLELLRQGKKKLFLMICFINLYIGFVMLVFRIHYMFDITTGIFMSHYIFLMLEGYAKYLDKNVVKYYLVLK